MAAITNLDPRTAVVLIVTPQACSSIRTAFCNQVHFFASPGAAQPWLDQHPDATILSVADAFGLRWPLTQTLLTADGESISCF
jgi:alkylmercury lyase